MKKYNFISLEKYFCTGFFKFFEVIFDCTCELADQSRNVGIVYGSCNNLDADFGSWMLDFASLHCTAWIQPRLHANCDGLVVISIVVIYYTEYTLPHSSHANNEHAGYCMRIAELNAV
jgi:hypothetical protein